MVQRWKILLFSFALAAVPLVGSTTAYAQGGRVYVREKPPAARHEVVVARPGKDYVYLRGHWGNDGGHYAWVPGRWDRPEGNHRHYTDGHWAHDRHGWYWIEGRWR